jgi:hypothetical protein
MWGTSPLMQRVQVQAQSATTILCVLCAADREVSAREVDLIVSFLKACYGGNLKIKQELVKRLRILASLPAEDIVRQIKDAALTFKSVSTAEDRIKLLEWARQDIASDGKITEEEASLFAFLRNIWNVGEDTSAMLEAQQRERDFGRAMLEGHGQRIMDNLQMWRQSW